MAAFAAIFFGLLRTWKEEATAIRTRAKTGGSVECSNAESSLKECNVILARHELYN